MFLYLDGSGSDYEYDAVSRLKDSVADFPALLLDKYKRSRKWGERLSCVYHAMPYARENESAYELGVTALQDKSKVVRYRACMLLALSLRSEAVAYLSRLLDSDDTGEHAEAAIDAIECGNQHYFIDREHSGMMFLNVQN